jgi:hypothetical protein
MKEEVEERHLARRGIASAEQNNKNLTQIINTLEFKCEIRKLRLA